MITLAGVITLYTQLVGSLPAHGVAGVALGAYLILEWRRMRVLARRIAAAAAIIGLALLLTGTIDVLDILDSSRPAVFVGCFIAIIGLMKTVATRSPSVQRCSLTLASQSKRRQHVVLSIGSGLMGFFLLFGSVNLLAAVVAKTRRAAGARGPEMVRKPLSSVLRGFVFTPMIAPISIPFVFISATYPEMTWIAVAPYCVAAALLVWGISIIVDRYEPDPFVEHRASGGRQRNALDLWIVAGVACTLFALIALVVQWMDVHVPLGAALVIPPFSAAWFVASRRHRQFRAVLRRMVRLSSRSLVSDRNEIAVIAPAIFVGSMVASILAEGGGGVVSSSIASSPLLTAMVPAAVIVFFVICGQLPIPPALIFLMASVAVPDPATLAIRPEIVLASFLGGWGLHSVTSPYNVNLLIVAREAGITPTQFNYGWNRNYILFVTLALATAMGLVAHFFSP